MHRKPAPSYGLSPSAKKTLPALCGFSDHKTQTGNHDGCREGSKQTQPSFLKRHQQRHNNRCRKFNRLKQAERVILNDQGVQDGTRQLPLTITAFKAKNDESGLSLNSRPDTILKPYKLTLLSLPFYFFFFEKWKVFAVYFSWNPWPTETLWSTMMPSMSSSWFSPEDKDSDFSVELQHHLACTLYSAFMQGRCTDVDPTGMTEGLSLLQYPREADSPQYVFFPHLCTQISIE